MLLTGQWLQHGTWIRGGSFLKSRALVIQVGNDDCTKHLLRSKFNQNWRLVEGKRKVVTVHPLREVSLRLWFAEGNCKHKVYSLFSNSSSGFLGMCKG